MTMSWDERRRRLAEIYKAKPQNERDLVDTAATREAVRQCRSAGFEGERYQLEVALRRDRIRNDMLTPADWRLEAIAEGSREPKDKRRARSTKTWRESRRSKDESVQERDVDLADGQG